MAKEKLDGFGYFVIGGIILVVLAAKIAYALVMYGDWSCAFATCVKVEKVAPK